ncbi:hypothetical protein Tco_1220383 [Tanacetum coccineum]
MRCEALITLAITHTTIVRRRALCDGAPLEYALILLDRRPLCTVRCSSTCNVSLYIWELNQFYALLDRYRILDCTVETRSMMSWDKYSVYVKGPRAMIRKALTKPLAWARRRNNYTYRLRKNSQESLPLYSLFSMNSRDRSAVFIISIRPSLRLSVACNFDVDEDRPLADTPIQDLRLVKIGLHSILDDFDYRDIQYIYAAGSETCPPMLNKENYVPWSSRLLRYAKSRPNGKLIYNSIINGPYVRRMIPKPGDQNREVLVNETFHEQTDDELTEKELKQVEADDQAIQTILLGLPE